MAFLIEIKHYLVFQNIVNFAIVSDLYNFNIIRTNLNRIELINSIEEMDSKKKCRQYSADYIKYGFVESPSNEQLPMCLMCEQVFSNEGMKPSRMIDHLKSRHSDKVDKICNSSLI